VSARVLWRGPALLGGFDWRHVAPWRAVRVTVGVVLPLVAGWLSGNMQYGAFMALGALPAGIVSFQGEARRRLLAVTVATIGMAVSTFVGAVAPHVAPWSFVPIIGLWAYLTGLAVCLGQLWSIAVLQWSVALLIAAGFPETASEAALRAGLVFAGGLLQALLVVASWTLQPGRRERTALATSYGSLATYARRLTEGVSDPPPATAFPAGEVLEDPNPLLHRRIWLIFVDLLEEAERMRAALAALAGHGVEEPGERRDLQTLMTQISGVLDLLARALTSARAERDALLRDVQSRIALLKIPEHVTWRWSGEALLGQLRAVTRIIAEIDAPPAPLTRGDGARARRVAREQGVLMGAFATLRSNATTSSEAGRHAIRLAVVAALAETIAHAFDIYQGRWATLTIFLVLKPDYASTFDRGLQRALGTVLGAMTGAAALELVEHGQGGMVAAAAISIGIAYAVFDASYLLFTIMLTTFVVVLLVLLGMPPAHTVEARIYDTLMGAALALTAYLVWPTWERVTAREKFARLAEAHREYATALLVEVAHPDSIPAPQLRALQIAARRRRSDAEAAATRLAGEPTDGRFTPEMAHLLIAAIARLAQAELAIHALVLSRDRVAAGAHVPGECAEKVDALKDAFRAAMAGVALAVRNAQPPEALPALRPIYDALARDDVLCESALLPILDRLVDATNTLGAIVRDSRARV